jgi:oligoribonuclease NrnB/cAMP/cGMP phosphodiesterase (DHH superfamily)
MSEIGARLAPDCDVAVIWFYDHEQRNIKVSLRAHHDNVDVSELAKEFGGGGHPKAAGFTLPGDTVIDDLFDVVEEKVDTTAAKEELDKIKAQLEEAGDTEKAAAIEAASALLSEVSEDTEEIDEVTA